MAYKFLNSLTVINSTFSSYNSGGTANDSLKVSSSNLGASFGVQNTNASGYAGIEYIDNSGNVKVFTGFNNGNGQEFRFNNVASGGYIDFLIGGTTGLKLFNNRNVTIGSATDAGYKLDVNGTTRFRSDSVFGIGNGLMILGRNTGGGQSQSMIQFDGANGWNFAITNFASTAYLDLTNDGRFTMGNNIIYTSRDSSAVLNLVATNRGFLQPRMTTTQRNAITTPATGLSIYNTTTNTEDYYNGSAWVSLQTSITNPVTGTGTTNYLSKWTSSSAIGNSLVYDDGTNVGIGTTSPSYKLDIVGNTRVGGSGNTRLYIDTSNTATPNIGFALAVSNAAKWSVAAYKPSGTNISYVLYNEQTGTNSLFIQGDTNNVIIGGTSDSGYKLDVLGTGRYGGNLLVSLNQNAETSFSVSNTTSGTTSQSSIKAVSSGGGTQLGKFSATTTAYKSIASNDGYIYNYGIGNISILNDYGSGNINFTSRGSSAAQVIFNGDTQPLALIGAGSSNFSMNANADVYFYFNSQGAVGRIWANPQSTVYNTYDQPVSVGFAGTFAGGDVWYGTMNSSGGCVKYNASINGTSHSHRWYHNFSEQMRLAYTGNLLIGTATDAGYKLDVNGTARINSTLALTNSTYAGTFSFYLSAANVFQASSSNVGVWLQVGGGNRVYIIGQEFNSTARGNIFGNTVGGEAISATTIIAQSSGTTATTGLSLRYTINNTGTYVGISRGIYYNPTITSLTGTTHRAIETVTGDVIFGSTSGVVGIGTTSLSTEANLYLGAKSTIEGGQLVLQKGTSQTYATHLDNYNNQFRVMVGTDTGSTAAQLIVMHSTGNVLINTGTDNGYKLQVAGNTYVSGVTATSSLNVQNAADVNSNESSNNLLVYADITGGSNKLYGGGQVKANIYTSSVTTPTVINTGTTVSLMEWYPTTTQGVMIDYVFYIASGNYMRSGTFTAVNDNAGNTQYVDNATPDLNGSTATVTFAAVDNGGTIEFQVTNASGSPVYMNILTRYIPNIF